MSPFLGSALKRNHQRANTFIGGYKLRVSASGLPTFTTGVINVVCIPFRRNTHDPLDTGPYS
jgi:hypothetical protein